jgi:hypothetical protein
VNHFIFGFGVLCLGASGIGMFVIVFWALLEGLLDLEDRIAKVMRVQPALFYFCVNHTAVMNAIAEHKSKNMAERGNGEQ